MLHFTLLHPSMTHSMLGIIPTFLSLDDPRPAKEQIHSNYSHGGGWHPMKDWILDPDDFSLQYPGDEKLLPLACAKLRNETLYFYRHAWFCIVQPDNSYEVARID